MPSETVTPAAEAPPLPAGPRLSGVAALRALAAAFAHLHDFERFVGGLQAALQQAGWFGSVTLQAGSAQGELPFFSGDELTLPLAGNRMPHGVLRASGWDESRTFGPEDLHLLAGLAEFLAAVLDRARDWREAERHRQLLGLLLNQAPVGIVAFDGQHRVAAGNDLARRWLGGGEDLWSALLAALPKEVRADGQVPPAGFHLRVDGRLVFGELRTTGGFENAGGVCVVVMTDLTSEQARLLDALRRETYRCQSRRMRLCFALLESPRVAGGLLQLLPELRAALPAAAVSGPYDANRVGVVFPELGRTAAVAQLRRLKPVLGEVPARAGVAELCDAAQEPEALLEAALSSLRPLAEAVRPALLLHDDSAAVNDALALVLGRDFEVVKSTNVEQTRQLLDARSFDALITEVELRAGSGLDIARRARERQPGILAFFTTVSEMPRGATDDPALSGALVLQKPFDTLALARTLKETLGV